MTRTPEEIKKGLECCGKGIAWDETCGTGCPYQGMEIVGCSIAISADALALIQQLERDKAWAGEMSDMLREENKRLEERAHQLDLLNLGLLVEKAQLEAERDAAIEALKSFGGCMACTSANVLKRDSPCKECISNGQVTRDYWVWRGVQKEE